MRCARRAEPGSTADTGPTILSYDASIGPDAYAKIWTENRQASHGGSNLETPGADEVWSRSLADLRPGAAPRLTCRQRHRLRTPPISATLFSAAMLAVRSRALAPNNRTSFAPAKPDRSRRSTLIRPRRSHFKMLAHCRHRNKSCFVSPEPPLLPRACCNTRDGRAVGRLRFDAASSPVV